MLNITRDTRLTTLVETWPMDLRTKNNNLEISQLLHRVILDATMESHSCTIATTALCPLDGSWVQLGAVERQHKPFQTPTMATVAHFGMSGKRCPVHRERPERGCRMNSCKNLPHS